MNSTKRQARIAGFLYLLASIPAPFGLIYVPSKLIVPGDAAATADHFRASENVLRAGIACELIASVIFIFVVLALYRLFKPVSAKHALAMATLLLVSLPISFLSIVNETAALIVVRGASFLAGFDQRQLDSLAYLFFRLHGQTITVAEIFWGLWLFPFGILVIRCGFIPRFLGYLLFVAGFGYLADSVTTLIVPLYRQVVSQFAMVLEIAELPIIFWLLIWGAKERPAVAPAS
ncbi:MAG TPA: DUF4386 domain-containing protein [Chthoniobacterales bacterium]|jgi:hypothetical protein|nr:DUF4386 domain-containing protein [Chthoniobacterales bacterium]